LPQRLHSVSISNEELSYWKTFSNSEKAYIFTSDSQAILDFSEYQETSYLLEKEFKLEELPHVPSQIQQLSEHYARNKH
jgi:hypothetical protein